MTQRTSKAVPPPNQRELQREHTRERLLVEAEAEFVRHGFWDASTARIAKAAGVAHGTVFLHFKTKDELLSEIVLRHAQAAMNELHARAADARDLAGLCDVHLELIAGREDFEAALAKDSPTLPDALKRRVALARTGIAHHFYERLKQGSAEGRYSDVEPSIAWSFWFGTLQYHLAHRELFAPKGGLIRARGDQFKKFFLEAISNKRRR